MSVFVEFELDDAQLKNQLKQKGYYVITGEKGSMIRKDTHIESVINELVPIVEKAGMNAWNLHLKEYSGSNAKLVAEYCDGRIKNYD
ncbi:MAG: hypothetical protein AAGU27_25290 [Dehalobacterium sp.]